MSILEKLENANVFGITVWEDKESVEFYEKCDFYYDCNLNKHEVGLLIDELTEIFKTMKD